MNAHSSITATQQIARVVGVVLTDNSIAYNVLADLDGHEFVFACEDAKHADELAFAINETTWIEKS